MFKTNEPVGFKTRNSSAEIGKLELEIFKFDVKSLKTYEKDLILRK